MKRQAKLLISCAFMAGLAVSDAMAALVGRPRRRMIVLYYHAVPAPLRARFAWQLDHLTRLATVIPAGANAWPTGSHRVAAITFDDAFATVVDNALPELAQRGLHCTIFAPSGVLGRQPDWAMETDGDKAEIVVDAACLKSVVGPLVTIGSHSISHPKLAQIPRDAARAEIAQSRAALEKITGEAVDLFAFPYGDHDAEVVEICRREGYRHVFTILPLHVAADDAAIVRGRVAVNPDDGKLEFALKARGAYAWMPLASALKRRLRGGGRQPARPIEASA